MSTKAVVTFIAGTIAAPISFLFGLTVIVGAAGAANNGSLSGLGGACAYAYPDPGRVADTMKKLTPNPIGPAQWERYAHLIGVDPAEKPLDESNKYERALLFPIAVRELLYTTTPAAITTPAIVWWYGSVPDDNDTSWQETPVPGWDGNLDSYIGALGDRYVTDPDNNWDDHQCVPPYATACPQPINIDAIMSTIRNIESGSKYTDSKNSVATKGRNGGGNPTGAYQFIYTTWNKTAGYDEAFMAPPAVQDERARNDIDLILSEFPGDASWIPLGWYIGLPDTKKVANGELSMSYIPYPEHNTLSIGEYQAKWLDHYTTISLPAVGAEPAECPTGGHAAVEWAETQIGAPYAAATPYRFGTPPWPGGTITGDRRNRYTFPAGTIVYDCSGFVVAAWRQAGVDLVAQYGLYGSQAFASSPLQEIAPTAIQPGDLAVYRPKDGVGHIVMVHHIEPDGTVKTIESAAGHGVYIGTMNWGRVSSIKRPALP